MDFSKVRIYVERKHQDLLDDLSSFSIFFDTCVSNLYYDLYEQPLPKTEILLLMNFSKFEFMLQFKKEKILDFLNYNKILLVSEFDLEMSWNSLIKSFNFKHPNLHRISENPSTNADIVVPSRFLTTVDVPGLQLLRKSNSYKDQTFFCLMARNRPHRNLLVEKMFNKGLLDKGKVVYHGCNDNKIIPLLHKQEKFEDLKGFNEPPHPWNDVQISKDYLYYNLEIVVETSADYHFITEKTSRPLIAGMPFLIVSSQNYIKFLKQHGFETYSNFIDESYDDELSIDSRIDKVIDILANMKKDDFLDLQHQSIDIGKHNREQLFYISNSYNQILRNKIYEWIKAL